VCVHAEALVALGNFHAVASARHAADADHPRRPASTAEARVLCVSAFVRTHGTVEAGVAALETLGGCRALASWERTLVERAQASLRRYGAWPPRAPPRAALDVGGSPRAAATDGAATSEAACGREAVEGLAAWAQRLYADGSLSPKLARVIAEREFWAQPTAEHARQRTLSAWLPSRPLRQALYSLLIGGGGSDLGVGEVYERLRIGLQYGGTLVRVPRSDGHAPFGSVDRLSPDQRRSILLRMLLSDHKPTIAMLHPDMQLAAAALLHWLHSSAGGSKSAAASSPSSAECIALCATVAVAFARSAKDVADPDFRPSDQIGPDVPAWLSMHALHRLAQWQAYLYCAMLLNQALLSPLHSPVPVFMNGSEVARRLCYAERMHSPAHAKLTPPEVCELVRDGAMILSCGLGAEETIACEETIVLLYDAVWTDVAAASEPAASECGSAKGSRMSRQRRSRPTGSERVSSPKRPLNRFSLLCDASSDSDVGERV
jgi:hypothetical protein